MSQQNQPKGPYRLYLEAFGRVASGDPIGSYAEEMNDRDAAAVALGVAHATNFRSAPQISRYPFGAAAIEIELNSLFFQSQGTTP